MPIRYPGRLRQQLSDARLCRLLLSGFVENYQTWMVGRAAMGNVQQPELIGPLQSNAVTSGKLKADLEALFLLSRDSQGERARQSR